MIRDQIIAPRIGLALSGGAARGTAHIGGLRALLGHKIPIDCVAGTSAGALVGGADVVIAVDVNAEGATFLGPPHSIIGIILQSMMVVQRTISLHQLQEADLVIGPRVGHIRWDETARAEELLAAGYESGIENIQAIKDLIELASERARKWYQFRRRKASTPSARAHGNFF